MQTTHCPSARPTINTNSRQSPKEDILLVFSMLYLLENLSSLEISTYQKATLWK